MAEKVIEIMKTPFVMESLRLKVSTSIGIAMFRSDQDIDEWIKKSDQALYAAKRAGRNRYKFADMKSDIKS